MFNIRTLRERFNGLSASPRALFIASVAIIFLWLAATFLVLNEAQVDFISGLQLDKMVHFGGGIFVAGFFYFAYAISDRRRGIYIVLAVGILWEIWELLFLPDQLSRFRHEFFWWLSDTAFDLVADILGAWFWVNLIRADSPRNTTSHRSAQCE